jgi:hypothetical protein
MYNRYGGSIFVRVNSNYSTLKMRSIKAPIHAKDDGAWVALYPSGNSLFL